MTKLAILGLDGATLDIIEPMIAAGELPNLARLFAEGVHGELESTALPITPPAWVSMMTGLNPGRHGVFHFTRRVLGTYRQALVDSGQFRGRDLFSLLSRAGWSVGGFAVPMTYPPYPVRGYLVSGIPMPMEGDGNAWPQSLWQELHDLQGKAYRPDIDYAEYDGKREPPQEDLNRYTKLREDLFAIERERIELMMQILRRRPTDLFFGVLSLTDRCQHYFWKFQDRTHPGWSREGEQRYGTVIADAYRLADEAVGRIRAVVGESCRLVVLSDHGFGDYSEDFQVQHWLEREGYLVQRPVPRWTVASTTLAHALQRARLGVVARRLPRRLASLPVYRPKYKRQWDERDIDWKRTRAFGCMYGICLNLREREPQGIVDPGPARLALEQEICTRLRALRDPETGLPVVESVHLARELFSGAHVEEAPDILFNLKGLSCLPREDFEAKQVFRKRRHAAVSGTHRLNGMIAMLGSDLRAGHRLEGMHIQDTTPSLLHWMQERIPNEMEGRVHASAFSETWMRLNPPQFEKAHSEFASSGSCAWTDADATRVEESLRGLGYL